MKRGGLIAVVLATAAFAVLVPVQWRIDSARQGGFDEELLYLPQKDLLKHFTAGLSGVVADVLWLKCIQYTTMHFKGDSKFTWLYQMCDMITTLDPHFTDAYRYGGIFLAAIKADDDSSLKLLRKGAAQNPDRWELPYEMAVVYLLNRRDEPGSAETAAMYLKSAVETGTAPRNIAEFAANLQSRHNLNDMEEAMWKEMRNSKDKMMRDLAERKLSDIALRSACAALTKAAELYKTKAGTAPAQLSDLVSAGIITGIPADPRGGSFILEPDGRVQSTTLLDALKERRLNQLRASLKLYHEQKGSWPPTLDDLKQSGVSGFVPSPPYAGQSWKYDPSTGIIE
ncbi:MAG: hypothetical protein HZB26_20695 [Candidatus Hydrogenedentes bacterium]|nr:hypothetical protein [Candidatus Hydrogenedentota bacterium]